VWHLTHRCHRRQFLLRFVRDRRLWAKWLYEARVRHGLCVLDYVVTSNHVHLVVRDRGEGDRIVDRVVLAEALDIDVKRLAEAHREWVEEALRGRLERQPHWSESVAVGGRSFAERVLDDLGARARDRCLEQWEDAYVVREPAAAYAEHFGAENAR
jgi:REP element-mobilizing transposase RayT